MLSQGRKGENDSAKEMRKLHLVALRVVKFWKPAEESI